jgi:hypothetical protein
MYNIIEVKIIKGSMNFMTLDKESVNIENILRIKIDKISIEIINIILIN